MNILCKQLLLPHSLYLHLYFLYLYIWQGWWCEYSAQAIQNRRNLDHDSHYLLSYSVLFVQNVNINRNVGRCSWQLDAIVSWSPWRYFRVTGGASNTIMDSASQTSGVLLFQPKVSFVCSFKLCNVHSPLILPWIRNWSEESQVGISPLPVCTALAIEIGWDRNWETWSDILIDRLRN